MKKINYKVFSLVCTIVSTVCWSFLLYAGIYENNRERIILYSFCLAVSLIGTAFNIIAVKVDNDRKKED